MSYTPPPSLSPVPPPGTTRRIKRIAPLSLGKTVSVIYGVLGLITIPLFLMMSAASAHLPAEQREGTSIGMGFMIFLPLMYAVGGFIVGTIGALIYNVAAKWIGGVEVEVE